MTTATQTFPAVPTETFLEHLELAKTVQRVLDASSYPELQLISVKVQNAEVILYGRVSSFFQKQLAQELVMRVPGVSLVRNEILVAIRHA